MLRTLLPMLGLAAFAVFGMLAAAAASAQVEINPHTGLALSGFDPVAYFTDHQPRVGKPAWELSAEGVVWRFVNPGNRAAFKDHPEVYAPRFGGYDPVAVARGAAVPGHPLFWVVVSERLYLFYSPDARTAFLTNPGGVIARAERKWPAVAQTIAR
jgi:YHS domain-containing protein